MSDAWPNSRPLALVLAGGNALGAFHAGAYSALHVYEARPDWVVGVSMGAINGALIAGNPADRRIDALRAFWSSAAQRHGVWTQVGSGGQQRGAGQIGTMLFGTPAVFVPNPFGLIPSDAALVGAYDLAPLRRTLERLIDFEFLNRGEVRLSVVATDLETGDEVVFDTRDHEIGPEHIMASCALIPDFRPIEIEGRLLGDGGLRMNLPVEVIWRELDRDWLCIAVDLFSARGRRFTIAEATARRQELLLANQSRWFLETYAREDRLRKALREVLDLTQPELRNREEVRAAEIEAARPALEIVHLVWTSSEEVGNHLYDYSDEALASRWQGGERAAADAMQRLESECHRRGAIT